MSIYQVNLKPLGAIDKPPGSARLYGALCWASAALAPDEPWFKKSADKFLISSCFLHVAGVRFLPLPCLEPIDRVKALGLARDDKIRILLGAEADEKLARVRLSVKLKKFSGIREASESLVYRLLQGEPLLEVFKEYLLGQVAAYQGRLCTSQEAASIQKELGQSGSRGLIKITARPHANPDRIAMSTALGNFFTDRVMWLNPKAELFFWVRTDDVQDLEALLRYLADTGIGGNRSSGMNQYQISKPQTAQSPLLSLKGPKRYLLSRTILNESEAAALLAEESLYQISIDRPRMESRLARGDNVIKGRMACLDEGSVVAGDVRGRLVTVPGGDHQVLHNGLAFAIPFGG